ncbi:putative vitellogenin receptor [Triplophysa tibetana]|uniref:Putative vitellogenin receptor n=1 Tax=Triplophysa tibetana TaxID=1572043 RepID=A0A5A9N372_9TELE|nr:putative vitellogenin receptor [Triplophysa tibetana]
MDRGLLICCAAVFILVSDVCGECNRNQWQCYDGVCIPHRWHCDGVGDCQDGSDEMACSCPPKAFECADGSGCVTESLACDGRAQCSDGSDELDCDWRSGCLSSDWKCRNNICIPQNFLCNEVNDCGDNSDEETCGKSCRNANGGCSHTCVDQTWGALCNCPSGMTLSANGFDCIGFPVKILTFRRSLIGLVNVKTRVFEPLLSIESDPIALTYDIQRNFIYWADNHGNIYKAYNHKSMVLYSGQPGVRSLAVDWLTGQLYWTSVTQKAIFTGTADGSSTCVVISKDTDPGEIVLSPVESFIFWINNGMSEEITIERTAMDGSNRTTLIFVTAQIPKGLTLDVAARRLFWISEFKMSIESIRTDGSGSYTFWNFFQGSPGQSLAVFNGWFYWADEKRLWQTPQNLPPAKYNEFLLKASLPVLTVYHELQQPQDFKVAYATAMVIYSLEFTGNTTIKTELFTSDEDIQAFDMHWKRGCVVWCNGTGHVKTNKLSQDMSEYILTLKPACVVRVDQKTGNLYWLACDELSIGVSTIGPLHQSISRQLYQARTAILDLFVDWQKGKLYWLEGVQIMRMKLGLIGGRAEAVFSLEENGFGTIAFDRKANSFLWNGGSFLQVMSLLKARKYSGGKEWVLPGSIVAAYEPYVVALSSNILSVWNRKDRTRISEVAVENDIIGLSVALREVAQDDMAEDLRPSEVTCISPLVFCPGSTVCISQSQQCDGKSDCPDGSDEAFCFYTCAKPGEFLCEDRSNCVERNLVCDGHSHCPDGSDEVGCPSAAPATSTTSSLSLKCRVGSKPCKDARECVLYSHVCDGEIDCKDGSDEDDCELQCKPDQFHCAHGRMCIDKKLVCDGTPQCQDRSDEADCFIRSHDCKHRCDNKTRCIPESFLCDGEKDCMDATDEENCNEINSGNLNLVENKGVSTLVASQPQVCRSPSMMCPGTLLCISQTRLCDGKLDCPDGSDEVSCMDTCAKWVNHSIFDVIYSANAKQSIDIYEIFLGDFLCKDRRKCVERNLVCDGQSHCLDGSDEVTCPIGRSGTSTTASLKCRVGSKPCQDGRECVMHSHVCDGEMDCKDGSDEVDCELQCKPDQFHCAHGRMCIEKIQVCDGTPQCQDRSDETDCFTRSHECKHRCDNKTLCIPESFLCDGEKDCLDATDEANCSDFLCKDRRKCVERSLVCDGRSHCLDGSDEVGCPIRGSRTPTIALLKCRLGSKPCKDGRGCVLYRNVCDGQIDCKDGSDEQNCKRQCRPGQFQCTTDGRCIEKNQVCDETPQCLDKSDEMGCQKASGICVMRCDWNTHCIPEDFICNGIKDCQDGADEVNCDDFLCKDRKKCVERNLVCDSRSHCFDGSDEVGCPTMAPTTSTTGSFKCRVGSKPCKNVRDCVLYSHVCDGEMDCRDGSDEEDCELQCNPGQFQCVQGKKCIDFRQVCDGIPQCLDHSDEAGCWKPTKSCSMRCDGNTRCIPEVFLCNGMRDCWDGSDEADCGDFMCKDRKKCVKRNFVCDARSNCVDGSDEVGCPTTTPTTLMTASLKCRVGSKPCKDGQECVLYSHFCDGEMDCKDGSDEADCSVNCKEGEFQCAHGKKCIDLKQVCDGRPQCQDFSDESDCFLRTKSCSHRCDNKTRCIPENFLCDGERDCVDGTDESDCGYPAKVLDCKSPSVLCSDGSLCIPHTRLCDGKRDCPDGIDEAFCFDTCLSPGNFLCKDRRKCVELNLVCDGHSHCLDGSDEVSCPTVALSTSTASLKCRVGSKPCKDGRECVLYSHVCDGEIDCKDGSDEDDCELQCKPDQFHCAHGRMCIDKKLVCDGTPQCQDRSDETDCFTRSHDCKHRCDNKTRCIPESFLCDGEKDCVDATDEANCDRITSSHMDTPTELVCNAPSVLCQKTSKCLAQSQLCDGNTDCPDGSDERSCIYACPDSGSQFLCKDRRKCILKALVCDGYSHCSDGSDEMQCPSCAMRCDGKVCLTKQQLCDGKPDCRDGSDEKNCYGVLASASSPVRCPLGSKPCKDGKECVLYSHVCDGEKDCKDGSDERGCERRCKKDQFQCAHGRKCIDLKLVCDGTPQCQDRSDEINCVKLSEECSHSCDNRTRCIPDAFLCDGEKDCVDGSDEDNCVVEHCPNNRFQCSNGQCLAMILRCDGYADCRDHSDEKGCPQPPHCPAEQLCPHTHECLLKEWFCDGDKDCSDGFDEKNCKVTPLECGEFQWSCASKIHCIPQMWKCDGMKDCDDGSDESGCGQVKCPTHLFRCGNGECVQPDLVCNRVPNCVDGSDEGRCGCKTGFRLQSDGLTCTDIDECTEIQPDVCSHNCLNTLGSYLCQCHPEYILEPDGQTCKTSEEPSLLVSGQYELLSLGLRSFSIHALITPGHKSIFSLDYDQKERCVYWVSLEEASIKYAFHGEKNNIGTIVKGVKSDSIAVDWIGRNLYWVDGAAGQILAVRLGSSIVAPQNYTVILDEDLKQPRSLVLLPQKGIMFWSEIGGRAQIERSTMDGSERKVVISHGLSRPVSITVDILTDRLYWTDEKLKYIGSATLDGENMRVLQLSEMASPFSVAVFNDFVYWSDTRRRSIQGANKLTGKNRKAVLKRPSQPFSLKIFTRSLQETGLKNWPVHRAFALRSINEASNFDLLLKDRTVFLADAVQGSVAKLKLSSSGFRPAGHLLQLKGDLVTALAVDWVSHNLYWSSIRSPQLSVTSPGGKYTLLVLQGELQETISIALHPPTGRLCFTVVSRRGSEPLPQVDCAHMDGSNRTLLWSKAKMPISLAFSDTGTALYWADTGAGSISSIDIDGSNYKEYNTGPAFIVSFARFEDIIFWVTLENGTIKVWYTDGFQPKQMWFEVKTNIVELKAYSKSSQKGTNFCSENNGGCSHLCLPFPSGRTCRCARDYLSVNATKCVSNLKCPTGSKACRDGQKCIHAAKFCDQVPDCQDGSDEECGVKSKSGPGTAELSPTQREVSVQNLDSRSCDAERCSKHGKCVTVKGEVVCKCEKGYSGDLCQNTGSSRTALALTLTFLFGGALLAAVIMKKRRMHAAGLHGTDKEMLVTDKEECTTFSQNFANELYNPEEESKRERHYGKQKVSERSDWLLLFQLLPPTGTQLIFNRHATLQVSHRSSAQQRMRSNTLKSLPTLPKFSNIFKLARIRSSNIPRVSAEDTIRGKRMRTERSVIGELNAASLRMRELRHFCTGVNSVLVATSQKFGTSFNMSVSTINPLADGGMSYPLFTCADDKCIQGRCVVVNGVPVCECKLGYMGDTCNETINEALSLPLTLGTLAFLIAFIILIFLLAFIRQKTKRR